MARLLSAESLTQRLSEPIEPGQHILAGSPTARYESLDDSDLGEVGLWEMTEGTVSDVEADEIFVVLAGEGELLVGERDRIALSPGVIVRLHAGDRTAWTVTRPLRKVYFQQGSPRRETSTP